MIPPVFVVFIVLRLIEYEPVGIIRIKLLHNYRFSTSLMV